MLDGFFKSIDKMVKQIQPRAAPMKESLALQECIQLLDAAWKVKAYNSIPNSHSLMVVFEKEEQTREIKLTLNELTVWVEILKKKGASGAKSI